ncbi:MAG: PilX N-terminal domain-containing pilus assembly protein, partial [Candidatus Competibacteraceae bacterium]
MKSSRCIIQSLNLQRGSILFVGLILMFILSVIGITSMRMTGQQEHMAANLRDQTVAFQAAEAALAGAEKTYFSKNPVAVSDSGAFTGSACTAGTLKYCPNATACASASKTPAPYLVAYGQGDGADSAFWKNTYKDYWTTCGSNTGIAFVDSGNYGKPGYPSQTP